MFHAQSDALRSASLGRQVGAAVTTPDGEVLATGTNEVPRAGGGLYWCDQTPDQRDHVLGYDPSDRLRRRLFADVLQRLRDNGWLSRSKTDTDVDTLVEEALSGKPNPLMKGAQLMNILEFGRPVHAEMAALMTAARRGIAVDGCAMYATTFPCHECARHIVASGIRKVVYIEPYPKSLVPELYPDSIAVEENVRDGSRVDFRAFVGIAPKRYFDSFSMVKRKHPDGTIVRWDGATATPRMRIGSPTTGYLTREQNATLDIQRLLKEKGLTEQRRTPRRRRPQRRR